MTSTQRPSRRRSARLAFDEDDSQPNKKVKTSEEVSSATAKQSNSRKTAGKKAKTVYDEEVDGFQFSKTRSRRATPKEIVPETIPQTNVSTRPATARGKASNSDVAPSDEGLAPKRRRSARLSGDKDQIRPGKTSLRSENGAADVDTQANNGKTAAFDGLQVEKARGPTKIALPFADTPVITRNKEMRKNSAQGHRRSSSGMRGRRASSLIDSGTSNGEPLDETTREEELRETDKYSAMPHSEVATAEFYKHISQDLPEPRRMQQLLSWCATRALPEKPSGSAEDVNGILAARVIQEELLKDFSKKSEMSDWFNRQDITPAALVKKPNPRNTQNAAKLQELEREVKRLEEEKQGWEKVLASLSSAADQSQPLSDGESLGPETIHIAQLDSPEQTSILSTLLSRKGFVEETASRLQSTTDSLEFKIDSFADGVHRLRKLKESADSVVDALLSNAASTLENRDRAALEKTGMEKVGIGDILRGISRVA